MDYKNIVVVTNRKICCKKHPEIDYNKQKQNFFPDIFPMLEDISDEHRISCTILINRMMQLVKFNVPIIILREKDLPEADYCLLAKAAISVCAGSATRLILHSFYETAYALGHRHIHLPLPLLYECSKQKDKYSFFETIGASIHSKQDATTAERLGVTYITAGHIFDTDCKKGFAGRGLGFLNDVCRSVNIPVYAIGGIDSDNLNQVLSAGAQYGCMMSNMM